MLDFTVEHDLPLIGDLFCGGGGASTGIANALGRAPDFAVNHNPMAIALHAANHPETYHYNCNIWDVEPRQVTQGRRMGFLWASPDCKHFSRAKGGKPLDRNIRDLAWNAVRWAEEVGPDVIMMENVPEFVTWGPIDDEGKPIAGLEGIEYERFVKRLKGAGYKVQTRELQACDYGAPTIRTRWFLIARKDGRPIVWPKQTHGDPKKYAKAIREGRLKPWRTAAECIDWQIPAPSIFETSQIIKEKYSVRAKRPLAENTLKRIARGVVKYTLSSENPFVVPNKSGAIAPSITHFRTGATGAPADAPLATITANSHNSRPGGAAPLGVAVPSLLSLKGTDRRDSSITDPHPTVLAGGTHSAVVMPSLAQIGYGERKGQAPRALDIQAPIGTLVGSSVKHAVVEAKAEPLRSAYIAQHNTGVIGRAADAPMSSITQSGSHQTPVVTEYHERQDDKLSHLSEEQRIRARAVADFLREYEGWSGGEYVIVDLGGKEYVMTDIGMRMLAPRELYRAQGFPEDYEIEGAMMDGAWRAFPKDVQISCVGNSVCPDLAEALVSANCEHLKVYPAEDATNYVMAM